MRRFVHCSCVAVLSALSFVACGEPAQPPKPDVPAESASDAGAHAVDAAKKVAADASKKAEETTQAAVDATKSAADAAKKEAEAGADKLAAEAAKVAADAKKAAEAAKPADNVDAAIATMREFIASKKFDKTNPNWRVSVPQPPKLTFDPKKTYFWELQTTEGPIKVRLMPDVAPMHVSSTIYLTEAGFYDGLKFHRVIPGFMAQGGDPLGNGTGSPGYKYAGEFSPTVKHDKPGLLSMANAGPNTDGSQFFLTFVPTPHLNGKHTIFGEVVEGLDNLKKLESSGSPSGATKKPLQIDSAKISVQ